MTTKTEKTAAVAVDDDDVFSKRSGEKIRMCSRGRSWPLHPSIARSIEQKKNEFFPRVQVRAVFCRILYFVSISMQFHSFVPKWTTDFVDWITHKIARSF